MKKVKCLECGWEDIHLADHLVEVHGVDPLNYSGELTSPDLLEAFDSKRSPRRNASPCLSKLTVKLGDFSTSVNTSIKAIECLPVPPKYRIPHYGALSQDVKDALIALMSGENVYIHGVPGCGKDALLHAFCGMTRRPSKMFQILPGTDVSAWLFTRGLDPEKGDCWREGELLQALRDGHVDDDGNRHPMTVLITDFDRADPCQAEILRLIMDSISGRIPGPMGVTYPVLPGSQVVCTGNSCGSGDETGMCVSANPMDASILDRFDAIFRFQPLDWKDESLICKAKFPLLLEKAPFAFDEVGRCVTAIRQDILKGEIFFELSHRGVCRWLKQAENIIRLSGGKVPKGLLKRSARAFIDGAPDTDTRTKLARVCDAHITGGSLDLQTSLQEGDLAESF